MSKKILISLAPLLAVAAFAVTPAMAQAETTEYGVVEAGVFKPFTKVENIVDSKVSADFVLKSAAGTITCSTFSSTGTVENVKGVGKSKDKLTFDGCTFPFEGKTCDIENITGTVTNEVLTETTVSIKLPGTGEEGFSIVSTGVPAGCPKATLGKVSGSTVGESPKGSNHLEFAEAGGLTFAEAAATITGISETKTAAAPKKNVIIN